MKKTDTLAYRFTADLPIVALAEVVVVGGGPAGIGAAVQAARRGARTLLIERNACPGGMAYAGEVSPFMHNHSAEGLPFDQVIYPEWLERMNRYWREEGIDSNYGGLTVDKDAAALAAEELLLEAGVEILYRHQLMDVVLKNQEIKALVLFSKSGLTAVRGKVYIDCTGDGDLAFRAGCSFEKGGENHELQPMTLGFKLSNIDMARFPDTFPCMEKVSELYRQAKARGEISNPRDTVLFFLHNQDDILHFNTTRVQGCDASDGLSLSRAEIEGHRQLREILFFFRKHVPGCEKVRLHSMGAEIGVRETRRIRGRTSVGEQVFTDRQTFPDGIVRIHYGIDIHRSEGDGYITRHLNPGEFYEIPYGCLVAEECDNLLMAGRCISTDRVLNSSLRVMPPCCSLGVAAGMAAAMALEKNLAPADLDGVALRQELVKAGASL